MRRLGLVVMVVGAVMALGGTASAASRPTLRQVVATHLKARWVSQAVRGWLNPPRAPSAGPAGLGPGAAPSLGSNADAANIDEDLLAGQAETAIAAAPAGHVMVAWNDATGFAYLQGNRLPASLTGVGYSADGGRTFTDLVGLRNPNPDQQWEGDPSVVAIDGGAHYIVGSLFFPSLDACFTSNRPAQLTAAVEVLTPAANGRVVMGNPIVVSQAGDVCKLFQRHAPPNIALLDKAFLTWDQASRTLAMSYGRFFLTGNHTGQGQIELARAHVPADPTQLGSAAFHRVVVWPEEPMDENAGAYAAIAPNGDTYVAWERNLFTDLFNGDPHVYEHLALIPAGATTPLRGGKASPIVITKGQANATPVGGVRSLGEVAIAGYNRGLGNDFPRVAWNAFRGRLDVAWNDASLHPLGDVWVRSYSADLTGVGAIGRANDGSDFALHFLPALSVRANGDVCTSWYDRSRFGPDSATTDYVGECRSKTNVPAVDFPISTGATDWTNTSTISVPNFGDYTDQTSVGNRTYFTWTDGRLGTPQPFADHR
jgi:hypothetical protein